MDKPSYCTNDKVGSCWECCYRNYGLDCRNRSIAARELGSAGGRSKSAAKATASRANGSKGGRPRKADKPVSDAE